MADVAEDVLTMWHLLNPAHLAKMASETVWHRLPWALLAIGTGIGGIIVIFVIKSILSVALPKKYRERLVLSGIDEKTGKPIFTQEQHHRLRSYYRVFIETVFFVGIALVLWIASYVGGFDVLSSSLISVGFGLVGTYMFATVIQQMGSGYWVYMTDKVEEGQYLRFPTLSPYIHGRLTELHPLYGILQRTNDAGDGLLEIQVPMSDLLGSHVIRDFKAEAQHEIELEQNRGKSKEYETFSVQDKLHGLVPRFGRRNKKDHIV